MAVCRRHDDYRLVGRNLGAESLDERKDLVRSLRTYEFDGMWLGSFTDSMLKGRPDTECVDVTSRLRTLNDILEITTKPIVYDGDSGGT